MLQKEDTFQVVINLVKNSTYFKAFTISANVPKIFMQQFGYSIKKVQGSDSYEFLLAKKKYEDHLSLTFLIDLGYKGPLYKHTNMFVDHMHKPWRTLATIINKCLSGKTASNDKLRKSRIDILWGMFKRENIDYPELIWEDLATKIDTKKKKQYVKQAISGSQNHINHFLKLHKSLINLNYQHYVPLQLRMMVLILSNVISILASQIHPKKSRGKCSQGKKTTDGSQETVDVSEESEPEPEPVKRKTSSKRRVKKKVTILSRNINPVAAKQVALDNDLVPPEKRLKIKKCNARIEFSKPQREETYQVTLDALKLSPCYPAFQITAEVPEVYMHQFWNTIQKIKDIHAYRFKLDKKKCRTDTEVFHEILQICPRLLNQDFVEPPSEDELVTFIQELGYSGKCDMLSAIHTDQMHQPWRTFAAIINRCIFGKTTGLNRFKESRA
ncbi:hypothetical protein Tco_0492682 [Tanacetum coccineum]